MESSSSRPLVAPMPPKVPEPTAAQRFSIRTNLDKHFDDETGRYLDGYSDRKIAEEIGLPAIVVKNIREMAYGPEKGDPEIVKILEEVDQIKGQLAALERRLQTVIDRAK